METFEMIMNIFWSIWIPWLILLFGSIALDKMGYPQLNNFIYYVSDFRFRFKERKRLKEIERINEIKKNGTDDERVKILNKDDEFCQYLTDKELKEKYKGLDFSKAEILFQPNFLYNIDTKKVNDHIDEACFIDEDGNIKKDLKQTPIPEGNRCVSVFNYKFSESELLNEIKRLNTYKKVAIFRHKTDMYRHIVLDDVK